MKTKIIMKNDKKYKQMKDGRLVLLCIVKGCTKQANTQKCYCMKHYSRLGKNENERKNAMNVILLNYKEADKENKKNRRKIEIINERKYTRDSKDKLRVLCLIETCPNYAKTESHEYYCMKHYNEIENKKETIEKLDEKFDIIKTKAKEIRIQNDEDNSIILNGIHIYVKNGKKYKKEKTQMKAVCMFEGCEKITRKEFGDYCCKHKHGTDPNSPERLKERKNLSNIRKMNGKETTKKGDDAELWVYNIMRIFDTINSIKKIGEIADKIDIIYKCNNETFYRGIQIKTLTQSGKIDKYSISLHNQKYTDNTLIVGINIKRNRFMLCFYKDINSSKINLNFNIKQQKFEKYMYTNICEFCVQFEKMLEKSSPYNVDMNPKIKQEYDSLARLTIKCKENRISYMLNDTRNSSIDCFINNYNIQCKSTSHQVSNTRYKFSLGKNNGSIDNKKQFIPYSENDNIDFFIFEIIGNGNLFYIIPIKELIDRDYIKTINKKGKKRISFIMKTNHWTHKYLNDFEQLKINPIFDFLDGKLKSLVY